MSYSRSSCALALVLMACTGGGADDASTSSDPSTGSSGEATASTAESTTTTTAADTTGGTSDETATGESTGTEPLEGYDDPALWLCHADKSDEDDQCRSADLTSTEVFPDGSTAIVEHVIADDPPYDCFYIYPTVDIRLTPGQTEDFDDISQELDPLLNQAARFTGQCRVFAPLYHQVTIGTFGSDQAEELLDAAYQDVADAFESYRQHHMGDRPFVVMGHSQGTYMTTRLLREVIETDEALRSQLITALMIGGAVGVPEGEAVGGSFSTLPVCDSPDQVGCVVAYRTYAADLPPTPGAQSADTPGSSVACTDPVALAGSGSKHRGAYLPNFSNQPGVFPPAEFDIPIETPFALYRDFYRSECLTDGDGHDYLAVSIEPEPDDVRQSPVDFENPLFSPSFLGLHVLDYNIPLAELMELVAIKADAMAS